MAIMWITWVMLLFHTAICLDNLPSKDNVIHSSTNKLSKTHYLTKKDKTTFPKKHSLINETTAVPHEHSIKHHHSAKYNSTITYRRVLSPKHVITAHDRKKNKMIEEKNNNQNATVIKNTLQTQTPNNVVGEKRHDFHHYYHPIHHFRHKLRHFHHHFRDDDDGDDFDDDDDDEEFFRPRISPVESITDDIEPIDRIGGIERIDPMEGIEPIDRVEPIERIRDIEPVEPIEQGERMESMVPMKSIEEEDGAAKSRIPKHKNTTKAHRRHFPHHNHTQFSAHVEELPIKRNPNEEFKVTDDRVLMLPSGTAVVNVDGYHNHHGIAGAPGALGVIHPAIGATGAEYSAKGAVDSRVGVQDPAEGVIHPATGVTDPAQGATKEATKATGAGPNTKLEKGVKLSPNEGFKKENVQESISRSGSNQTLSTSPTLGNTIQSNKTNNSLKVNGLNQLLDANSMKNVLEVTKSLGISINQTDNTDASIENHKMDRNNTTTAQRTLAQPDGNSASNLLELTRSLGISINQTDNPGVSRQDHHVSKSIVDRSDGNVPNNVIELIRSLNISSDLLNNSSVDNTNPLSSNTTTQHRNMTIENTTHTTLHESRSIDNIHFPLNNSKAHGINSTATAAIQRNISTNKSPLMMNVKEREADNLLPSYRAKDVSKPLLQNASVLANQKAQNSSQTFNEESKLKQSSKNILNNETFISSVEKAKKLSFVLSGNVSEANYQSSSNKTTTEVVGESSGDRRGVVIPGPAIPSIEMEPVKEPEKIKDIELDKTEIPIQDGAAELAKKQQKIPDIKPIDMGQLDSRLMKEVIEPIKKPELLQVDIEPMPPIEPIPPIEPLPPIER